MPVPSYDAWTPSFTLWSADGATLLYRFMAVTNTNIPQNPQSTVVMTNFRASGAVVINGGNKPFEGFISGWIFGNNVYADVISQIDDLYTLIPVNVPLILKIDKSPTEVYSYNVKRIEDFDWQNINQDLRQWRQEYTVKLLVGAW